MSGRIRIALVLLAFALGSAGCEDYGSSPLAPTKVVQVEPPPAVSGEPYTLTVSSNTVVRGGQLSVSWTAPKGGARDWIALTGVTTGPCQHGWSEYTGGGTSGTFTLTAPNEPGQYEFRYQLNNGCEVTAVSTPVTVVAGS